MDNQRENLSEPPTWTWYLIVLVFFAVITYGFYYLFMASHWDS